ncbi:MAG: DUF4337 domain-containing protein [Betaproteobacteria bacterium]|nr:DUF4337 domain-containing protein [Betaproteobacteria bacterium]
MSHATLHDPSHDIPHGAHSHNLAQWVAIFTALLATLGAIVGYQGSRLMHEVLLYKNESVLKKAQATDQWNYYQAISTKEHVMELALELLPPERAKPFAAKIEKYRAQKDQVKTKADAFEAASEHADAESDRLDRPYTSMALAMIFLQIAISLASITALTGRAWLFAVAGASAAAGIVLWATGFSLV